MRPSRLERSMLLLTGMARSIKRSSQHAEKYFVGPGKHQSWRCRPC